ncbi:MAG TPA: T9SS type A sorting domain-containing protein [Flavobacterium sp.]
MKTIYLLLFCGFIANAQVTNRSFEELTSTNKIRSWGQSFSPPVSIDLSDGSVIYDEIIFDGPSSFSFASDESYGGDRAIEIRNAYNATQDIVIPGSPFLFNSENSEEPSEWSRGIPIELNANVDFLGFFYKFLPLGNEIAEARLALYNAEGLTVGTAIIEISEPASEYTYISAPVNFSSMEVPTFMTIDFTTAKEGTTPVFGSRLVIDEVTINSSQLQVTENEVPQFAVFPTISTNEITIMRKADSACRLNRVSIFDYTGKNIKEFNPTDEKTYKVDISTFAIGTYLLKLETDMGIFVERFMKK